MKKALALLCLNAALIGGLTPARGEFLFNPTDPSPVGFFTPTLTFYDRQTANDYGLWYEYSAWDVFYSPNSKEGNYPDIFAPAGGVQGGDGLWYPEVRPGGYPASPDSNPQNPHAFWDAYNPTITQVKTDAAFIVGPNNTGNIYSFQEATGFQLHNKPDYNERESTYNGAGSLGTVLFQFQTEGATVDFNNIVLKYVGIDGNTYSLGVNDLETEYLREYSMGGSEHWSASAGYRNRVLLQWDLSAVENTGEFWIEWESLSSSMSFQKADLTTASYYELAMPGSTTWGEEFSSGLWSGAQYWREQRAPQENGNLKFKNSAVVEVDMDDGDHTVGEIIFENANDVTIGSSADHQLTANTGVTVRSIAADADDRVYTFDVDYTLGALNFFEVNSGTVVMNGAISGDYGIVKLGDAAVVMNGENTFGGFLTVQGGELRINGSNLYSGSTTVIDGRLIISHAGALGTSSLALAIGGDASLYTFIPDGLMAELHLDGDVTLNRDIALGAGDLGKRLGAMNTVEGAIYSGAVSFSGVLANPDAQASGSAVGNTFLTTASATDRLIFTGAMTGGNSQKSVTIDGPGEVVYAGANKTYSTSTVISSGTLLIESETQFINGGAITVANGARLDVKGGISGVGNVTVNGGVLNVDGTISGSGAFVFNGGRVSGTGQLLRELHLGSGSILAPGNSVGKLQTASQVWAGGGIYLWEIASAAGISGSDWDLLDIDGSLRLTATAASPFELRLSTLGPVVDFDETLSYSWLIAMASEGIEDFDASLFFINTDAFSNPYSGSFFVSSAGGNLYLQYEAVPEPSSWILIGLGAALYGWSRWKRSSANRPAAPLGTH